MLVSMPKADLDNAGTSELTSCEDSHAVEVKQSSKPRAEIDGDSTDTSEGWCSGTDESDCPTSDHDAPSNQEVLSRSSSTSSFESRAAGVYTRSMLLSLRKQCALQIESTNAQGHDRLFASPWTGEKLDKSWRKCPASPGSKSGTPQQLTPPDSPVTSPTYKLTASPTSWSAARLRRTESTIEQDEGVEVQRFVKSILNKITIEKFEKLYEQLTSSSLDFSAHTTMFAKEIHEKALLQHNFAGMYADLCARCALDFVTGSEALKQSLLTQCWQFFTTSLLPPPPLDLLCDTEENCDEGNDQHKKRILGNARFMGELFIRNMIPTQELFVCTKELLKTPLVPDKIEALVGLLTVVGHAFDSPDRPERGQLREVFWHVRGLTFDPSLPKRIRCKLQDLLDLRETNWTDNKEATRVFGPKKLKDVQLEAEQGALPQMKGNEVMVSLTPANNATIEPAISPEMSVQDMLKSTCPPRKAPVRIVNRKLGPRS